MSQQNKENKIAIGLEVSKKDRESTGSLLRRFTQRVRQSGLLYEVRQGRYFKKEGNKRARRDSALVRAQRRKEYKKLRKWGKA